ncbi:MAG: IclR family transcriptional regulator [Clostridia bacterium]|nr:IclR family transcriptional regulator [Clostridia bacterium]
MSKSLERGLQSLLFLSSKKSVGVTELAEELQVNKSTAFRVLETLRQFNMAEQNKSTSKYKLGPAVLKLSEQLYKNLNIISIARPHMQRISEEVGESVHLCILSNDSAVVIEQIMTSSRLTVNAKIGNKEPLHSSSVGKCLIAFSSPQVISQITDGMAFEKFSEKTIASKEDFFAELEKVRQRGYAIDDGEISEDIRCIAVPIFNYLNEVTYSMGVSGPTSRMTAGKIESIAANLIRTGGIISAQLGFSK